MTMLSEAEQPAKRLRRRRYIISGVAMPRDVDGRTLAARRYKELVKAYSAELGTLTAADLALVAQAAAVALRIEKLQADIVEGRDVDEGTFVRMSGEHRRLMNGLRARAAKNKPAAPDIMDFAAQLAAESESEVEA